MPTPTNKADERDTSEMPEQAMIAKAVEGNWKRNYEQMTYVHSTATMHMFKDS